MTVFLLQEHFPYEGTETVAVYSTREKAEVARKTYLEWSKYSKPEDVDIEEVDLDRVEPWGV